MTILKSFTKDPPPNILRNTMTDFYRRDETECVELLLPHATLSSDSAARVAVNARALVEAVRLNQKGKWGLDTFLYEYHLSSQEGIALMCLAESLLRIPDADTMTHLIRDKIPPADWESHLGKSSSVFVNAATWGLMLTGKVLSPYKRQAGILSQSFKRLLDRTSEPFIRMAVTRAMRILGKQFVMGQTIQEALQRAQSQSNFRFSFDMLGEAARTEHDAARYLLAYEHAIQAIGQQSTHTDLLNRPGISIKLSALHPRYEFTQQERVILELAPKLKRLALLAKEANINLTVDAEEADRLDLSLEVIAAVFADSELAPWEGFGLAVQSYQKRAFYLLDWLTDLARRHGRKLMIRLIKGAYWDSEIKWSQERGYEGYPVFTRKANTDVSFIACARKILQAPDAFYPQFATHNAQTVATIMELTGPNRNFEFQCLYGMGQSLYEQVVQQYHYPCRIYAPVGTHEELLPYLVRRLLENGANTSFVNRIVDAKAPVEELIMDPVEKVKQFKQINNPQIPLPRDLFVNQEGEGSQRINSQGLDLSNHHHAMELAETMVGFSHKKWRAQPTVREDASGAEQVITSPADHNKELGVVCIATDQEITQTLERAKAAFFAWDHTPVETRAALLERIADGYEQHRAELITLICREGGRTIPDAIAEVREAVDFCRYYAALARKTLVPQRLPGPTGEQNELRLCGRGPIICISPWNFPVAIFTGQVVAALVAGNSVIAKPSKQTTLTGALAVDLMHKAGIPPDVLQLLPVAGAKIGEVLIPDERIKGVVFTGSTETATTINKILAARVGEIIPFIAETGGQNTMIVDSSALPEQVVNDVLLSAFNSAGQRCSALRVLFLQEEVADKIIAMLKGAMAELVVGDPITLDVDVGPVIDEAARKTLLQHKQHMEQVAQLIYEVPLPSNTQNGTYFAPCAFEIKDLNILTREVFGPILHVIRYKSKDLDQVIDAINHTGYGLTLGIHSRINERVAYLHKRLRVGNCYVNRNMIGAVVGVQPFGGEGLSGTGPKAGGPHYLQRMCHERTLTINLTAAGGNATLMSLRDPDS